MSAFSGVADYVSSTDFSLPVPAISKCPLEFLGTVAIAQHFPKSFVRSRATDNIRIASLGGYERGN
jgi:hypothetical protein